MTMLFNKKIFVILVTFLCFLLSSVFATATVPLIGWATVNSTDNTNYASEDLTVYTDLDSDSAIKLIYDWYLNSSTLLILNMPFEGGSLDGTPGGTDHGARDYSPNENNGTVYNHTNMIWSSTAGYDGK
jgi:hypothetical protein